MVVMPLQPAQLSRERNGAADYGSQRSENEGEKHVAHGASSHRKFDASLFRAYVGSWSVNF